MAHVACCSAQTDHNLVETIFAKQTKGAKNLLSYYYILYISEFSSAAFAKAFFVFETEQTLDFFFVTVYLSKPQMN